MQTRRCPPRCLRAPSSGAVQALLVPGAGCCGCCCGPPICLLCGFQACAESLCWPLHQFATATSEAPCQHACLPILVRPAGWRPAHAASLWLGMPRMPPSMSGQQVGSTCWRPLRHNVQTVQSQYQPASCHFCLCHSTESASLSDAALPCPADLSEVVTRVGLGETEVDMVDSLGVSGAGREGVGVAEQCVLANAACTAHHEREREMTWPGLTWPAAHHARMPRTPAGGGGARHAARPACVVRQRRGAAVLGGGCSCLMTLPACRSKCRQTESLLLFWEVRLVLFFVATAHYCRCCRCLRSSQCRICSSGAHMPLAPSALLLILTAGCRRPACAAGGRLALVGHRQRRRRGLYHRSGR